MERKLRKGDALGVVYDVKASTRPKKWLGFTEVRSRSLHKRNLIGLLALEVFTSSEVRVAVLLTFIGGHQALFCTEAIFEETSFSRTKTLLEEPERNHLLGDEPARRGLAFADACQAPLPVYVVGIATLFQMLAQFTEVAD